MTDRTPGSRWLLPVTITEPASRFQYAYAKNPSGCEVPIHPNDIPTLIPADRITELEAEVARLREALQPFADAAEHLHPAHSGDALTLDAIKVSDWRAAWAVLNPPTSAFGKWCHACQAIPIYGCCSRAGCPTATGEKEAGQ